MDGNVVPRHSIVVEKNTKTGMDMTDTMTIGRPKTPWHLWAVGAVSLIWHLGGAFDYSATQFRLDFYMSNFTEDQLEYYYGFPWFMDGAWAFGVWGAFSGSILLLLRSALALWAFALSIAGLLGTTIYTVSRNGFDTMGDLAFTVVIWVLTLAFTLYAFAMKKRGVLR